MASDFSTVIYSYNKPLRRTRRLDRGYFFGINLDSPSMERNYYDPLIKVVI
tara:strand:+ start:534 stop:686 length:153 start_codon:yes stop_codon:yes gene_type:complete